LNLFIKGDDMPRRIILDFNQDPDLLDITAREWAEAINKTKKTQIRNFYDKILELQDELKRAKSFSEVYPFVKMLNSKVAYGVSRRVVSKEFQEMMQQCLSQIQNNSDGARKFEIFKLFFEAVLGFFKGRE